MQGDARPGESLHMRHLRPFINGRGVADFLLQHRKDARRGVFARLAGTNRRVPDPDAITEDIKRLIGNAGDDHDRTGL
jgi:hypothetical protein